MEPFKTLESIAVPIDIPNCDTDQIIPARFLRRDKKDPEYSKFLFHDLRFNRDGTKTNFIMNQIQFRDGSILVADTNWGCGSSRENAVYALQANGIRSIIAPSIADIHYNNCIKNGVLPILLSEKQCKTLRKQLRESPGAEVAIDLETQTLSGPDQTIYNFQINEFDKFRLLNGLDDIGVTMKFEDKISAFTYAYRSKHRWAS